MKKLCYILFFFFSVNTFADDTLIVDKSKYTKLHFEGFRSGKHMHLQLGGDIGLNLNYFIYKQNRTREYKDIGVGYQGGFFFRISKGSIYTQFDFNFLRTAMFINNSTYTNGTYVSQASIKFNTVGLPVVLGVYAYKNSLFKLRFFTGLEANFLIKAKLRFDYVDGDNVGYEDYKLSRQEKKQLFRTAQFAYQAGVGVDVAMIAIDFKYSLGIRNYIRDDYVRTQTHLFQLLFGVIF